MARILYFAFPSGRVQGGHKVILRHVEALREMGFDAYCVIGRQHAVPTWLEHRAPILREAFDFRPDDVIVLPDDGHDSLRRTPPLNLRCVVIAQGPYIMSYLSLGALDAFPPERQPSFIAVSQGVARFTRRLYPSAHVDVVPCFVDERLFRPGAAKQDAVTCMPKKRPFELGVIRNLFGKLHARYGDLEWREFDGMTERTVAESMGASRLHLALARLEGLGLASLEAMATGGVCAGFLGLGGREYATQDNGFWVADDDCMAAADALAEAADLVRAGGAPLRRVIEAGQATAAQWSYAAFREALEPCWMRLAPDARLRAGPLD